jgi:hypothetical protein
VAGGMLGQAWGKWGAWGGQKEGAVRRLSTPGGFELETNKRAAELHIRSIDPSNGGKTDYISVCSEAISTPRN